VTCCSTFIGPSQVGDAAPQQPERALGPVEDGFESRGLDLAPFQAQGDAVENEQLVLDPVESALDRSSFSSIRRR